MPFLGIYLKETKSVYNRDTCTPMFAVALYTIGKLWNQPECSSTEEWVKKTQYTHIYQLKMDLRQYKSLNFETTTGKHRGNTSRYRLIH
jgi:hypothetical protein